MKATKKPVETEESDNKTPHPRANAFITRFRLYITEFLYDVKTVFKYPVLLTLMGFDIVVVIPVTVFYGGLYFHNTFYGLALLPITQLPITVMTIREAIRQSRLKPPTEAFETSPEKWQKAFDEYQKLVKEKK